MLLQKMSTEASGLSAYSDTVPSELRTTPADIDTLESHTRNRCVILIETYIDKNNNNQFLYSKLNSIKNGLLKHLS